jgi:hypothetical protein
MPERSQAGIVSRITRKVASEPEPRRTPRSGVKLRRNMAKTAAFRR